jgi:anti-anti-sigma regulatory factor
MQMPTLITRTDPGRRLAVVEVSGPLTTSDHASALADVCAASPAGYGLITQLSAVTTINDTGLDALRSVAECSASRGQRVAFVCSELMMRADLVLSDLDTLAPVVADYDIALPLVSLAA